MAETKASPKLLLECHFCGTWLEHPLTNELLQALLSYGGAELFCTDCRRRSLWRAPTKDRRLGPERRRGTGAAAENADGLTDRRSSSERRGPSRREWVHGALKISVRMRALAGKESFVDMTETVNLGRGGIYIQSERSYREGMAVVVNLDPHRDESFLERQGTVVRVDELPFPGKHGVWIVLGQR